MNTEQSPIKYAILEYVTQKYIFNCYSCLQVDRLLFELVRYDPERQRQLERAISYLPVTKAKLLAHLVLTRQAARDGWKLELFGGSRRDGQVESRTFRAEYDTAGGRFASNPWRLTIAVGPGKATGTGGIAPDGEPAIRVSMRFPADDFVAHMLEVQDFLHAHQLEIELVRQAEQLQHYHERQERHAVHAAVAPARTVPARLAGIGRSY